MGNVEEARVFKAVFKRLLVDSKKASVPRSIRDHNAEGRSAARKNSKRRSKKTDRLLMKDFEDKELYQTDYEYVPENNENTGEQEEFQQPVQPVRPDEPVEEADRSAVIIDEDITFEYGPATFTWKVPQKWPEVKAKLEKMFGWEKLVDSLGDGTRIFRFWKRAHFSAGGSGGGSKIRKFEFGPAPDFVTVKKTRKFKEKRLWFLRDGTRRKKQMEWREFSTCQHWFNRTRRRQWVKFEREDRNTREFLRMI